MTSNSSNRAVAPEAPVVSANDELPPASGIMPSAPDWAGEGLAPPRQALGAHQFPQGRVVAGKYRIERKIGEGAMGVVVAATHLGLDETVAIKFILPDAKSNPEVLSRFAKEAKISAKIRSEHITKVLDVGVSKPFGPYIVMEYLEGESLADVLEQRGKLPADKAIEYVLQACEALAAAHSTGVIHRDIKPGNLFVTRHGSLDTLKLLDFGISKAALTGCVFGNDLSLTATTHVVGTPMYMSPEQVRSCPDVDSRTDLWSLGAVLYELLTGKTAFVAESITEICANILEGDKPKVPAEFGAKQAPLQAIIERCLERDVTKRYQTVVDLAAALMPLASNSAQQYADRSSCILRASSLDVQRTPMPPASSQPLAPPPVSSSVRVTSLGNSQPNWTAQERRHQLARNALTVSIGLVATLSLGILLFPKTPATINEGPVVPASLNKVQRLTRRSPSPSFPPQGPSERPPNLSAGMPPAERVVPVGPSANAQTKAQEPRRPVAAPKPRRPVAAPKPPRPVAAPARAASAPQSSRPPRGFATNAPTTPAPERPRLVTLRPTARAIERPALVALPTAEPSRTP